MIFVLANSYEHNAEMLPSRVASIHSYPKMNADAVYRPYGLRVLVVNRAIIFE